MAVTEWESSNKLPTYICYFTKEAILCSPKYMLHSPARAEILLSLAMMANIPCLKAMQIADSREVNVP